MNEPTTGQRKPKHDELLEIARELHEAASMTSQHARTMEKKARELDAQATQLRVRADEALVRAVEDGPDERGGWDFEGVRAAARKLGAFTVEQFTRTLGIKPIHTIGWIRALVDEGLLTEDEDADGLRIYRYAPADDEEVPEDPPPSAQVNGHSPMDDIATLVERRSRTGLPVPGTGKGANGFADPDVAKLAARVKDAGGDVTRGGSGHFRVYFQGRMVASMANTPSDHRALANTEAQLKRAGLPI